ncbi:hypothetical protein Tco_1293277 [Tanacetum coccineum]
MAKPYSLNEWDLGSLEYSQETEGPYHTDLPTPEEIHQFLQFQRVDPNRTIKHKNVILSPNQVLTKELRQDLKRWKELIYENVFRLGGHRAQLSGTSSSFIDYTPKSPTSSTSPSTNGYLNSLTSPPSRVHPPLPTQENTSMDITLTLSPITSLDVQFNTQSPSPPIFGLPIPWNLLEAHGDSCLCCI